MNKKKRDLFKAMSIVGVGAVGWKKPVVDAVILPLHAQMSSMICSARNLCDLEPNEPNEMDIFVVSFNEQNCSSAIIDNTDDLDDTGDFVIAVNIDEGPQWRLDSFDNGSSNWLVVDPPPAGEGENTEMGTQQMTVERRNTGNIGQQFLVEIVVSNLTGDDTIGCADVSVTFSSVIT